MISVWPIIVVAAAASRDFDWTQIATIIGTLTGAGLGIAALVHTRREARRAARLRQDQAKTTASIGYVDTNLRTMQQTIDWTRQDNEHLRKDNEALRLTNEAQRIQIADFTHEMHAIEVRLSECQALCEEMRDRLERLERGGGEG